MQKFHILITAICILGSTGLVAVGFNLNIELLGEQYKTIIGQLMMLGFTFGQVVIGLVAMYVQNYKTFQVVLSVPCFILLASYFVIPESPRWLIAKKKFVEANAVIHEAARFYNVRISFGVSQFKSVFYNAAHNIYRNNILLCFFQFILELR